MILEHNNKVSIGLEVIATGLRIYDQIAMCGPSDEDVFIGDVGTGVSEQVILIGELYGVFHRCDAWSGHLRIVRGGIVSEGRNFVLARDEVHDASRIRFRVSTQKCVVIAEVESVVSEVTPEVVMVAAVGT